MDSKNWYRKIASSTPHKYSMDQLPQAWLVGSTPRVNSEYAVVPLPTHSPIAMNVTLLESLGLTTPTTPEELQSTMEIMSGYGYSVYECYAPEATPIIYPTPNQFVKNTLDTYHYYNIDPIKYFAPLDAPHKKRVCFYLYHLQAGYSGTSEYSFSLLNSFIKLFGVTVDIHVLISEKADPYLRSSLRETGNVTITLSPDQLPVCDVVFMTAQLFSSYHLSILYQIAPRQVVTFLDGISWRCHYLNNNTNSIPLNALAITLLDGMISISKYALSDVSHYFSSIDTSGILKTYTYLASDFQLKKETGKNNPATHAGRYAFLKKPYVLVFGNPYRHKSTPETVAALRKIPEITKVVVGGDASDYSALNTKDDYVFLKSGGIPEEIMQEIYTQAHLLVFPSQYEGFGLPIFKALQNRKKIVVFNTVLNHELAEKFVTNQNQLFFFQKFSDLPGIVRQHLGEYSLPATILPTWDIVATETYDFIQKVLDRPIDEKKVRIRWYMAKVWGSRSEILPNNEVGPVPANLDISFKLIIGIIYRYLVNTIKPQLPKAIRKWYTTVYNRT